MAIDFLLFLPLNALSRYGINVVAENSIAPRAKTAKSDEKEKSLIAIWLNAIQDIFGTRAAQIKFRPRRGAGGESAGRRGGERR
ncbi:MAG: hypothetical protein UY96_C0017G0003 [Parcubacteria group bacterium GW2011_GWB1_56_8]|nr:MAG: hypothetical protein UY96_C0017G0003 [Parcubacteria group bacterium GW2011_GWB1_56_8]